MAESASRAPMRTIHPLHAFFLAATFPLYLGGFLSDWAYCRSYQIQWSNFAAWLIAGAMVFTGLALLWALVDLIRSAPRRGRPAFYFLLLAAIFLIGLLDSFVHTRDAWGVMPEGPILSAVLAVLAVAAAWIGFSTLRAEGRRT